MVLRHRSFVQGTRGDVLAVWLIASVAQACSVAHAQGAPDARAATSTDASVAASRPDASVATTRPDASAVTARTDAGAASPAIAAAPDVVAAPPPPPPPPPPYTGPRPYVFLRPARVGPGLVADQIARLFRRGLATVESCYTSVLATEPQAHGLATARVTVIAGGVGTVDSARVAPAMTGFDACLRAALGAWEWPNPRNQPAVSVTMQIELAPVPPANPGHH